jgi:hypothetical protein
LLLSEVETKIWFEGFPEEKKMTPFTLKSGIERPLVGDAGV